MKDLQVVPARQSTSCIFPLLIPHRHSWAVSSHVRFSTTFNIHSGSCLPVYMGSYFAMPISNPKRRDCTRIDTELTFQVRCHLRVSWGPVWLRAGPCFLVSKRHPMHWISNCNSELYEWKLYYTISNTNATGDSCTEANSTAAATGESMCPQWDKTAGPTSVALDVSSVPQGSR